MSALALDPRADTRAKDVSLRGNLAYSAHHDRMALELPCPNCGTQMYAEQAHNRCPGCLYYEPCCDGAPQPCRVPAGNTAQATQTTQTTQATQVNSVSPHA
jgi:hypothetical protein